MWVRMDIGIFINFCLYESYLESYLYFIQINVSFKHFIYVLSNFISVE